MNYDNYIQSKQWSMKKREAYALYGFFCKRCGENRKGFLHVHHITYESFTNEKMKDLAILCINCHSEYHSIFGSEPDHFSFNKFIAWKNNKTSKENNKLQKEVKRLNRILRKEPSLFFKADRVEMRIERAKANIDKLGINNK